MTQESISDILARNLARKGLLKAANSAHVCAMSDEAGKGDFVAISFRDGVLKLSVTSAAKAHLIKLRENQFIDEINDKLKGKIVKKVVFKID